MCAGWSGRVHQRNDVVRHAQSSCSSSKDAANRERAGSGVGGPRSIRARLVSQIIYRLIVERNSAGDQSIERGDNRNQHPTMTLMKRTIRFCSAAVLLSMAALRSGAEIIAGPITNPENGHDYYLLAPNSWTASEREAAQLCGTLAFVRNPCAQHWLQATFSEFGGTNRNLWIGLRRIGPNTFAWVTDA